MLALNEAMYRDILSSRGLSQESIDYISTRRDSAKATKIYWTGIIIYGVLFVSAPLLDLLLSRHLFLYDLMKSRTQDGNAIFYDSIWQMHIGPVIFLAIFLPGYIIYSILEKFPRAAELVALKSIDDMVRRSSPKSFKGTVTSVADASIEKKFIFDDKFRSLPIHEALRYLNQKSIRWTKWGSILTAIPAIILMILDTTNYTVVTTDGVRGVPYGSFHTYSETWNDVSRIETGCYLYGGRNPDPTLKYDIIFNDGFDVDLFAAKAIGEKLDNIQKMDIMLRKMGKPFQLGKVSGSINSGQPFLNDGCIDKTKKQYPEDYRRIFIILGLEKYS